MKKWLFFALFILVYSNIFAQTYQNHFLLVITDAPYNGKGDGTTDNSTAFLLANDSVAAHGGGTIWIPKGIFKVTSSVSTQVSNTTFTGDKGAVVHFTSNASVGFYIKHDSCSVIGLTIHGANTTASSIVDGTPIYLENASYCRIIDNIISGAGGNGIELNATGSSITSNYNLIKGNTIVNPKGTLNDNAGIMVGYAISYQLVGNLVTDNVIQGNHVLGKGILMLAPGYDNVFDKNEISNVNAYGIALYWPSTAADSSLRDNHITNNRIYYVGNAPGVDTTINWGSGIYVQSAYRTIITDNTVRKAGVYSSYVTLPVGGISLNSSSASIVAHNIIDSCTYTPGINGANLFVGAKISDNHVYNSALGIQLQTSNGVDVSGNQLLSVSGIGINIKADTSHFKGVSTTTGHNYNVSENIIQSGAQGISFVGQTYDTCSYNHILNNNIRSSSTSEAIVLTYFGYSQVNGNISNTGAATYGIYMTGTAQSIDNDVNNNQLYNTSAFMNGIYSAAALNSCVNNYIPNATNQLSIAGITYNANQNIVNGQVLATDGNTLTFTNKTFGGTAYPTADQTYDFGNSTHAWAHVYTTNLFSDNNLTLQAPSTGSIYFSINGTFYGRVMSSGHLLLQGGGTYTDDGSNLLQIKGGAKAYHLVGGSTTPTIAAGAAAGASPTVSIAGSDLAGKITITTGTGTTTGTLATITFNSAFGSAPFVTLTPAGANSAALSGTTQVYPTTTTTMAVINSGSAALAASTTYTFYYTIIQ